MQSKGTIYSDLKLLLDAKVAKEFGVDVPPLGDFVAKIGEGGQGFHTGTTWQQVRVVAEEHSFFHWDLEFPDIFYDANGKRDKNPGFDAVVGNPPYINVENLPKKIRSYFFNVYQHCKKRTDIYIAFIEHTLKILKNRNQMCFIIPASFNKQKYAMSIRQELISKYTIQRITDLSNYKIFENAQISNIIIQIINAKKSIHTSICLYNNHSDFSNNKGIEFTIESQFFKRLKNCRFDTNFNIKKRIKIKNTIWKKSIQLDQICLVAYGARLNDKTSDIRKSYYIHDQPKPLRKKYCEGRDIDRYRFSQRGWLDYVPENHYNPMFPELFENEKLMAINVVTDRLRFSYDVHNFYNSHTVINCVRLDLLVKSIHQTAKKAIQNANLSFAKKYNYKFMLGILNSQLINWYFINFLSEDLHFYPTDAKELPIPRVTQNEQKEIINIVEQILKCKRQNINTKELEIKVDSLVYQLYELPNNYIDIIKNS